MYTSAAVLKAVAEEEMESYCAGLRPKDIPLASQTEMAAFCLVCMIALVSVRLTETLAMETVSIAVCNP